MKSINYKKKSIELIGELHTKYPSYDTPRHVYTALADYGDFWGMTEKEFCFALEKYMAELELDGNNISSPSYVDKIVEDAKHLFDPKEEEEDF